MNWTDTLVAACTGLGSAGGVGAAFTKYLKGVLRIIAQDIADDANKPLANEISEVKQSVTDIRLSLATQFGGNGGGMREAINKLQVDVAELKGHITAVSVPSVVQSVGKHEG